MAVINVLVFAILIFVCRAQEACTDGACPDNPDPNVKCFLSVGEDVCVPSSSGCLNQPCPEGLQCVNDFCYQLDEPGYCVYAGCIDEKECFWSVDMECHCTNENKELIGSCNTRENMKCQIGKGCYCGDKKCDEFETCDSENSQCLCDGGQCGPDEICTFFGCIELPTTTTTTTTTTTSTTTTTTSTTTAKPCVDSNDNCKQSAGLCQITAYVALMKSVCPFTCGYCTPPASTCVDVASNCLTNQRYCADASLLVLMKAYCPATCGYCSASCTNKADDCSSKTQYCKQTAYVALMKAMCAAACGYC